MKLLRERLSAIFLLLCFCGFVIGTIYTLPPHTDNWSWPDGKMLPLLRGKHAASIEDQFETKLSYKDHATNLWGDLRYSLFNTGSKGVIIGEDSWLFTKEEFEISDDFDQIVATNLKKIRHTVDELNGNNIKVVMAWIPAKSRIYADKLGNKTRPKKHLNLSHPTEVPLVDGNQLFGALHQLHSKAGSQNNLTFMRTDTHWSQAGASAMAEAIANYVRINYPELELTPKNFRTTRLVSAEQSKVQYEGDLVEFIPTQFVAGPADAKGGGVETIQSYQTEIAAPAPDSEDEESTSVLSLFGDEQLDVTLIGTSYSAQKDWHFEGFLKTALQADVLNLADEGQGPFAPMDAFLDQLRNGAVQTKLVIWEFPERYLPRAYQPESNDGDAS